MSYDPGFLTDRNRFERPKFTRNDRPPYAVRNMLKSERSPSRIDLDKHDRQRVIELDYDSVERRYTFDGSKEVKSWLDNLEKSTADQMVSMTDRHHYRNLPQHRDYSYERRMRDQYDRDERKNLLKLNVQKTAYQNIKYSQN